MSRVAVVGVGEVAETVLQAVEHAVEERLGWAVLRLKGLREPDEAHDVRRGQTNSTLVLRAVLGALPAEAVKIIGVTESDLFIPMLTFVFGQAQLNGPSALISVARLRQEYYGMAPDGELLIERLRKETLHELGHTFGLIHCPDVTCAMSLSVNLPQVDVKLGWYCEGCSHMLGERMTSLKEGTR